MKWVRDCCPKVDERVRNAYGALVEKNKESNKPASDFHMQNQATMIAMREAVQNGDVDRLLDMKFKQEYV